MSSVKLGYRHYKCLYWTFNPTSSMNYGLQLQYISLMSAAFISGWSVVASLGRLTIKKHHLQIAVTLKKFDQVSLHLLWKVQNPLFPWSSFRWISLFFLWLGGLSYCTPGVGRFRFHALPLPALYTCQVYRFSWAWLLSVGPPCLTFLCLFHLIWRDVCPD